MTPQDFAHESLSNRRLPASAGRQIFWAVIAALLLFVAYVALAWTPSHYGYAAQSLGVKNAGPIIGIAREIRSDDWSTLVPYYQIAVANGLGPVDLHSPFRESLKSFVALPTHDWSVVFKPDLWGFLFLDPAHAFSLHFAVLAAAMLAGFSLLASLLGCSPEFSIALALLLFLSQFVQVWWTTAAPVLGWSPWPAVVYLWNGRWYLRMPAMAYATAVLVLGDLYPPWLAAAAFALAFLILAFRPEMLRFGTLIPALVGAATGVAIAWTYFGDLIPAMEHTVYPGQRRNNGGGVAPLMLLAHLFPYAATSNFEPIQGQARNACAVGVVGSYLPIALAIFADHRQLATWVHEHRGSVLAVGAGLVLMVTWCCLPIPSQFAPGFNLAPGFRMVWGLGLLLLLATGVVSSAVPWVLTPLRVFAFGSLVFGQWVLKLLVARVPIESGVFDLLVLALLPFFLVARRVSPALLAPRRLLMATFVATAALTFGRFNPVQPAGPIFQTQRSALLDTLRAYALANPRGLWAVAPGWYGAMLNGAGVPSINHMLLRPQPELFRHFFPTLDDASLNQAFNRYEAVNPAARWDIAVTSEDGVAVPIDPFAAPLAVVVEDKPPAELRTAKVVEGTFVRLAPDRWGLVLTGQTRWKGIAPTQTLYLWLDPAVGRVVSASGFRLPSSELVAQLGPQFFAADYGVRLELKGVHDRVSLAALRVSVSDR